MRRGSKGGSYFSWADEVEKEEQEAAVAQWQKKPNPFGSARPREVVLQEKGIDWRQLDLHLQQASPLPLQEPRSRNPQPVIVTSTPQIQSPISLVPPLRYPPKYVAGFLYEHWNASGYRHLKLEKENQSPGGGKSESVNTRRKRRRTASNELVEAKEAQQKGMNLPLVNQNIGTPEMSLPANGIVRQQPRNIPDEFGIDQTAFRVTKHDEGRENGKRLRKNAMICL
ncbi:hypothetical protein Godav_005307 [Gossypium davidsonii]|uniref:Uncharacterized protein n=1 Tax=Gossypium davidsonii TaxID=34287 RepID=A0A7J8TDW6_GOSDV|nr:hypothetical protein [Gossypium davidsonii]